MTHNLYGEPHEAPRPGKVLLYSGGLDSYATAALWKPDVLLYVAAGHRYKRGSWMPCTLFPAAPRS